MLGEEGTGTADVHNEWILYRINKDKKIALLRWSFKDIISFTLACFELEGEVIKIAIRGMLSWPRCCFMDAKNIGAVGDLFSLYILA